MEKVAIFEKVSFEQYLKDFKEIFEGIDDDVIKEIYDGIILPKRATVGSAGYDFFMPIPVELKVNKSIKIPTGVRCKIADGWFLAIFPKSGLGFKYRFQLDNTVGIIDSDYYNAKNEGHIIIKIANDGKEDKKIILASSASFAQGIFLPFGITNNDEVSEVRTGGFGSTSK